MASSRRPRAQRYRLVTEPRQNPALICELHRVLSELIRLRPDAEQICQIYIFDYDARGSVETVGP
jgi:hypothetical protein